MANYLILACPRRRKASSGIDLLRISGGDVIVVFHRRRSRRSYASKNERQGRSTNIFFFHEGSLQGHRLWASTRTIGNLLASLDGVIVYELPIEPLRTPKPLISQIFC